MTLNKCERPGTQTTWNATYAVEDGNVFHTGDRVIAPDQSDKLVFETGRYLFEAVMHQMGNGDCHTAVGLWQWK
jgi:hypothetical protein